MHVKYVFYFILSFTGFVATFYSVGKFMIFISGPSKQDVKVNTDSVLWALLVDMMLLTCFALQHTLMVNPAVKRFLTSYSLDVVSRSIYIIITSSLLLAMVKYWRTTSEVVIWHFDTTNNLVWLTFNAVHLFAWSIIYAGCLFMDLTELLGIKQVYYSIRKMPDPICFKSTELKRLYGHTRHPSFSAFCLIFWFYPIMTLDRFLLATVMTIYMYLAWKTDKRDLIYQQGQYTRKKQELLYVH